jgi:hypothetical protein
VTRQQNNDHHRVAVDGTAEDYWESYFGTYGKQWVRKIPRRVATALLSRTAGLQPGAAAELAAQARVIPVMPKPVITEDRVYLEAALDLPTESGTSRRLFCAEFDHDGRLLALDSVSAPA